MPFADVSTITREDRRWTMGRSSGSPEDDWITRPETHTGAPTKYLKGIALELCPDAALVTVTTRDRYKVGCRGAGAILAELLRARSPHSLPSRIFVRLGTGLTGKLQVRCLLPLQLLEKPTNRARFMEAYSWRHHEAVPGESASEYERRAVDALLRVQPDLRLDDHKRLFTSIPDGLAINQERTHLAIFEAKKLRPDLAEGVSQLLLYSSQIPHLPRYRGMAVSTTLVTSDPDPTPSYLAWLEFMRSDQEVRFFVEVSGVETSVKQLPA